LKRDDPSKAIYSYIASPMRIKKLPEDIKRFECFIDSNINEMERLYSYISNHLFRHFQYINKNEFLDESFTYLVG